MSGHSRLAASAANRWIRCTGSVAYIEQLIKEGKIPAETTSSAATLGTDCHTVLEYCLEKNKNPLDLRQYTLKRLLPTRAASVRSGPVLTVDTLNGVAQYWQYIVDKKPLYDDTFPERKYLLTNRYDIDVGGTADITQCKKNGNLHIGDYKNGRTLVEIDTFQLKIYALGAFLTLDDQYNFQDISVSIGQPNQYHPDGTIRADNFSVDELLRWEEQYLAPAIKKIKQGSTELIPGDKQCEWCPARAICPANTKQNLAIAQLDFAEYAEPPQNLPQIASLTKEQIVFILDNAARLNNFLKEVDKHAKRILESGERLGRYFLEEKQGNRKILPENDLIGALDGYDIELKELKPKKPASIMGVTEIETYLAREKGWDKAEIKKFMGKITTRSTSSVALSKSTSHAAQRDFANVVEGEYEHIKKDKKVRARLSRTNYTRRRLKGIKDDTTKKTSKPTRRSKASKK